MTRTAGMTYGECDGHGGCGGHGEYDKHGECDGHGERGGYGRTPGRQTPNNKTSAGEALSDKTVSVVHPVWKVAIPTKQIERLHI